MMKRTIGKLPTLVLVFCIIASMALTGCGANTNSTTTTGDKTAVNQTTPTSSPAAAVVEEPYEFTAFRSSWQTIDENTDPVVLELNQKLNIKIRIVTAPYESWEEKYNVMMASGTVPDVSVTSGTGWGNFNDWCKQGKYMDITELYKQYCPNVAKYVSDDLISQVSIGGKLYGVPKPTGKDTSVIVFRKDWLDKVGLPLPATFDEYDAVMRAFTFNDPDGNNKNDTYGMLTDETLTLSRPVFLAFGLDGNIGNGYNWYKKDDGTLASTLTQPEAKDAIKYLAGLYKEGIMDPDWMLTKSQGWADKLNAGKGGIIAQISISEISLYETNMKSVEPKATLEPVAQITSKDGTIRRNPSTGYYMMSSISSKVKRPEKILEFIDYLASDEGGYLLKYGIEDLTYTKKDGKIVVDEKAQEKYGMLGGHLINRMMFPPMTFPATDERTTKYNEMLKPFIELGTFSPAPPVVLPSAEEVASKQGGDYVKKMLTEMVCNKVDVDANWDKFIADWRATGGDQLTKEINEAYKASSGK